MGAFYKRNTGKIYLKDVKSEKDRYNKIYNGIFSSKVIRSELPPLSPTCLKWGLLIEFPLKANTAVPAVFSFIFFCFYIFIAAIFSPSCNILIAAL